MTQSIVHWGGRTRCDTHKITLYASHTFHCYVYICMTLCLLCWHYAACCTNEMFLFVLFIFVLISASFRPVMHFVFVFFLTCICPSSRLFRMTLVTVPHHTWRHTGAIVRYWNIYRVSRDAFRSFSKRYSSYALRKHICGSGLWGGRETMNKSYHTLIKYNRYA
jgi:hypothetical protein